MTNDQMKAGRILKLQRGRRLFAWINENLDAGRKVYVCTVYRVTALSVKHKPLVKLGKSGSVYLGRDCIDHCDFKAQ